MCGGVQLYTVFSRVYFYQEICMTFSTCDLYCGCEKRGRYCRFHACAYPRVARPNNLGATGGSMATRRCSYTAAFRLKLVEYAERHGNHCARSPESGLNMLKDTEIIVRDPPKSGLSQCGECAH